MPSVTVSRTAVNQMIVATMVNNLSGVRLYLFEDLPPDHDPDQDDDTNVNIWCKLHRVSIGPRQSSSGADERGLSMTITVGVSASALSDNVHALSDTLQAVADAIEHARTEHSDGVHVLHMDDAETDVLAAGSHEGNATGVVSVTGSATRKIA